MEYLHYIAVRDTGYINEHVAIEINIPVKYNSDPDVWNEIMDTLQSHMRGGWELWQTDMPKAHSLEAMRDALLEMGVNTIEVSPPGDEPNYLKLKE